MENSEVNQAIAELHTILDVVRWSVSRFHEAELYFGHGTDNAWDEAVSLTLQSLFLPQQISEDLFAARLTTSEKQRLLNLVQRRINERVPAAYLTNQAWFCDLPFYVDERVLVPRSPVAELIRDRFDDYLSGSPANILDLCTGSGCIAIACAHAFPDAQVDALDISSDALDVAEINIDQHDLADRVFPICSDVFDAVQGQTYDLIVSNPPYVDAEDMASVPLEFQSEPEIGLAAGDDGLDVVNRILRQGAAFLKPGAWLIVEVGNSLVHVEQHYADLDLHWIQFKLGGAGVFAVQKQALEHYFSS